MIEQKQRKRRYINNHDFAQALAIWKREGGNPPITDYIAECFLKIVKGLGSKKNFSGYTYIADMKSEALEQCVKYANRFNIEKSENAFAYFTQISYNAFLQYLNKEKKYAKFRFDMTRESMENSHKLDYSPRSSEEIK